MPKNLVTGTMLTATSDSSTYTVALDTTAMAEYIRDTMASALAAGANVTIGNDDAGNTITISASGGGGGGGYTQAEIEEFARDAVAAALVAGTNVTITPNDGSNTITITATGGSSYTDEQARDAIGTALVEGAGITKTVNDAGDTITLAVNPSALTVRKSESYTIEGTLTAPTTGIRRLGFTRAATLTNVAVFVGTAPTGTSAIFDVNKNGTTIFTTQANRPTIAVSTAADLTSVPDVTSMSAGDYLTVDTDQVGSVVAGAEATVIIEWTEALG